MVMPAVTAKEQRFATTHRPLVEHVDEIHAAGVWQVRMRGPNWQFRAADLS